jgi:hypothetical protein
MPKVGHRGSGVSKNLRGKLLVMPPSENQQRSALGGSVARRWLIARE